jgi:molybdopterin-binding protein
MVFSLGAVGSRPCRGKVQNNRNAFAFQAIKFLRVSRAGVRCSLLDIANKRTRPIMKLSARNQISGKVVAVQKGQTTAHVRLDIGNGVVITSSITNEAVDDLGLKVGDQAIAVIKASDVMVAK